MSHYSDMRELNDLLNVTRKGKLFLVDIYDHTRLNLGIIRLYDAGDKLLMNVVGDVAEENDLSTYVAKHNASEKKHKIESVQVKYRDLEISEKDPCANVFYDAEDVATALIRDEDDDREKDDYLIGYWLNSFAHLPRVGEKLTIKEVRNRKFRAAPRNVVQSSYNSWFVRNDSGDNVGWVEECDVPGIAKKYAGHALWGYSTSYGYEGDRWSHSTAIGASLEECSENLLNAL